MSRKTKRLLTDDHWKRLAPRFPKHPPSPKGGRPRADDRECLEGLLWLLRTGARWQLDALARLEADRPRHEALTAMFERYLAYSEEGIPVHTWPDV